MLVFPIHCLRIISKFQHSLDENFEALDGVFAFDFAQKSFLQDRLTFIVPMFFIPDLCCLYYIMFASFTINNPFTLFLWSFYVRVTTSKNSLDIFSNFETRKLNSHQKLLKHTYETQKQLQKLQAWFEILLLSEQLFK